MIPAHVEAVKNTKNAVVNKAFLPSGKYYQILCGLTAA